MKVLYAVLMGLLLCVFASNLTAHAESRFALLIGNQTYPEKVGPLKNPHNDIALVGAALENVGFKVTRIKDAGYRAIDTALKRHIQEVRRAGKGTISLVDYSGHGAADPDTQINYLIPVDVTNADDAEVWTNSLDLREIVNRLQDQSSEAVHYVVFDACREELHLTREGTKALERKGFVPVANISGVMIAYATAPGKTSSDAGNDSGVCASALAEEIGPARLPLPRRVDAPRKERRARRRDVKEQQVDLIARTDELRRALERSTPCTRSREGSRGTAACGSQRV